MDDKARWIDQRLLPGSLCYRESADYRDVILAIQRLEIRGAPLIGIAGAIAATLYLRSVQVHEMDEQRTQSVLQEIAEARPTAVNLRFSIDQLRLRLAGQALRRYAEISEAFVSELSISERDACTKIAEFGAPLLAKSRGVLTHCNTGPLATGGIGTAFGVIATAVSMNPSLQVFATETRPLRQGSRLTVWEFQQWGVDVTLLPDSAAAMLLASGQVDAVITGADRVTCDGDVANKVGTAMLALACEAERISFYSAFPWSTVDARLKTGAEIPIEFRSDTELVHDVGYAVGAVPRVWNPAFDITPGKRVTGFITDRGYFSYDQWIQEMNQPFRSDGTRSES